MHEVALEFLRGKKNSFREFVRAVVVLVEMHSDRFRDDRRWFWTELVWLMDVVAAVWGALTRFRLGGRATDPRRSSLPVSDQISRPSHALVGAPTRFSQTDRP